MKTVPFLLSLLLLSGCGLFESKQTRAMRATPAYRAGYSEGCTSAGGTGTTRDSDAYAGNAAYRRGWNEGFGACRNRDRMIGGASGGGPIADPGRRPF